MSPRLLPLLIAAAALLVAPTARALSEPPAAGRFEFGRSRLSPFGGNFSPSDTKHPALRPPRGTELRWGALGPDREGGLRFGARLSGPAGTWTLDHSSGHRRGGTTHRFRLGFARRF